MSKGSRLSRLLPKFFRSENKSKDGQQASSLKGPFCSVVFLDDTERQMPYKNNSKAHILFDQICDLLDLLEKDYFGLRFVDDTGQAHWLDVHKSVSSQLKGCSLPYKFYFGVKFYAADPCKLGEEITRYLFFLQVKRDILQGRLPVTFDEAAELCGYALQSELGDFDPRCHSTGYVSEFCFVPNQTEELEARISGIHRRCVGATPLMAEHRFLEKVQWLEMYGVDLHPVQGEGSVEYFLGLTPAGVVVYKHKNKVASYFWPRVTKASNKGKMFMLKVKDKSNEEHLYAFELSTKIACKHIWKCCVEHHAFFSGRSERQAAMEGRLRRQPRVERAPSRRRPRRVNSDSRIPGEQHYPDQYQHNGHGLVTMMGQPEPVRAPRHRSLPELHGRQSPRSVKSAPWESNFDYGLYTSGRDSPSTGRRDPRHASVISAGSDSESGISQRKRYFPGRKGSDNESDGSASRRRRRERDSDSGSEVSFTMHNKGRKKRNPHAQMEFKNFDAPILYPFHDKENHPNGSIPSLHSAPAGEVKQRRRRRRSKSPGNSKRPPEELKQHIEFDLIDTEGMSEEQLRDITYTKVETKGNLFKVKYSPKFRQKIWASRRKSFGDADKNSGSNQHATLTRQESCHTDPAGAVSSSKFENRLSGQSRDHQDYGNSSHQYGTRPRHGDWGEPSPRSERSGAASGYNSAPASRSYHNPVYQGHRDALPLNNDSNNNNYGRGNISNKSYNRDNGHIRPNSGTFQRESGNYSENNFNYQDQRQPQQQNRAGPYGRERTNQQRYNSYNNQSVPPPRQYPPYQSAYDADVSRMETSRLDSTHTMMDADVDGWQTDSSRAQNSSMGARSSGRAYNQGYYSPAKRQDPSDLAYQGEHEEVHTNLHPAHITHIQRSYNDRNPNQRQPEYTPRNEQVDMRSTPSSSHPTPSSRYNTRSSYGERNTGYSSTPSRSSHIPNGDSQQATPLRVSQPYNRQPGPGHMYNQDYEGRPSSHNQQSRDIVETHVRPASRGVPYNSPATGLAGGSNRFNTGMSPQQQYNNPRDSYGAYRVQNPPPPYPRSPSNIRSAGPPHSGVTPPSSRPGSSGSRSGQQPGHRMDLITQI